MYFVFEMGTIVGEKEGGNANVPSQGEIEIKKPSKSGTGLLKNFVQQPEETFTIDKTKAEAMYSEAQKLLDMLDEYYGGKENARRVLVTDEGWAKGWEGLLPDGKSLDETEDTTNTKMERNQRLIDVMKRALLDPNQDTFKVGILGSSVAAGHDNCAYDNYSNQLMRLWAPVWEAGGMKVDVQNAGEGGGCGDSHKNQVYCMTQNVSPDVDILHYVWTYFEAGGVWEPFRESYVRWAQMLHPRRPPVHVTNVGDANKCLQKGGDNGLFNQYDEFAYNGFCMRKSIYNSIKDKDESIKGEKFGEDTVFKGKHVGDGLHQTTRYGEGDDVDPQRRDGLGVVMRNWHPGPLGFQRISDGYAYVYTLALMRALDALMPHMDSRKKWTIATQNVLDTPRVLKEDLPDPLHCEPRYCTVDAAPTCLNLELPTYGWWGASIVDPDDFLNPYKGQNQNWKPWKEDKGPGHMVPVVEQELFKDNAKFCEFPDHCAAITAKNPEDGRIVFKLPKMNVGMVAVCVCCGKKPAVEQILENEHVVVELNGEELDRKDWDLYPETKCVRLIQEGAPSQGPTGHSYLSFEIKEGNHKKIQISHLITI